MRNERIKNKQINFILKKKIGSPVRCKRVKGVKGTQGKTDVWLTPKAEIMTHQSFQWGHKETSHLS